MNQLLQRWAAGLCLVVLPSLAFAQSTPLYQSGTMTKAHDLAKLTRNGQLQDAGGVLGDLNGRGVNPFAVLDSGDLGLCANSASSGAAYRAFCMGHDASGNAILTIDAYGGATAQNFNIRLNGTTYPFNPAGAGNIAGPNPTTINELTLWNSTSGVAVKDGAGSKVGHTYAFPGSFGSTPDNAITFAHGTAWPLANQIPAGVPQNVVSTMTVPITYSQAPWPATNFSAYCDNQNVAPSANSCVPYFSVALADGGVQTTAYGANPIISNTDVTHYLSGAGFGKDFGALFGNECDINVWTKAAGATPAGNVRCFEAIGGGNVMPSGGAYAFHVDAFAAGIPWTYGFVTEDGAAGNAMLVAALAGGTNQDSQAINFRTYNASAVEKTATIKAGHDANSVDLDFSPNDVNGRINFQVNAVTQYYVDGTGIIGASSALATNAIGPFIYINGTAGVPTGVPTNASLGRLPLVIDTTNHKICWHEAGTGWKCALGS